MPRITEKLCKQVEGPVIDHHSSDNALEVLEYYYTFIIGCRMYNIAEEFWTNGLKEYMKVLRSAGYTEKKLLFITNRVMKDIEFGAEETSRLLRKVRF